VREQRNYPFPREPRFHVERAISADPKETGFDQAMKRDSDCLRANVQCFAGGTNAQANLAVVVAIVSLRHFNEEAAFNWGEAFPSF
jgi:hypothetical protein